MMAAATPTTEVSVPPLFTRGRQRQRKVRVADGRLLHVRHLFEDPRVAVVKGLVDAAEASHLIGLARGKFHRSKVVEASGRSDSAGRTSSSTAIPRRDPVVAAVLNRVKTLVRLPTDYMEAPQVVRYDPTQQYKAHLDWFQPKGGPDGDIVYHARLRNGGQRLITVFVYLNTVPEKCGGATEFPCLKTKFQPELGTAVLWYNRTVDGKMDERTLHAGLPVVGDAEKYGMNIWVRENDYLTPYQQQQQQERALSVERLNANHQTSKGSQESKRQSEDTPPAGSSGM